MDPQQIAVNIFRPLRIKSRVRVDSRFSRSKLREQTLLAFDSRGIFSRTGETSQSRVEAIECPIMCERVHTHDHHSPFSFADFHKHRYSTSVRGIHTHVLAPPWKREEHVSRSNKNKRTSPRPETLEYFRILSISRFSLDSRIFWNIRAFTGPYGADISKFAQFHPINPRELFRSSDQTLAQDPFEIYSCFSERRGKMAGKRKTGEKNT